MSTGVQRLLPPTNKRNDRIFVSGQHTYLVLKSASGLTSSNTMLPLSIAFMAWNSSSVIRGTIYRQTTFRQNCLLYCLWKQTLSLLVYLDAGCGIREWQGGCIQFCKTTLCMYVNVAGAVSDDAHCMPTAVSYVFACATPLGSRIQGSSTSSIASSQVSASSSEAALSTLKPSLRAY